MPGNRIGTRECRVEYDLAGAVGRQRDSRQKGLAMLSKLRSYCPGHGTVVAYLALFVALGGSSYAAVAITGRDVRDGSLTGRDIRNNSLTGRDIRGISGHDVRNNSLTEADVANLRRGDFVRGQLDAGHAGRQFHRHGLLERPCAPGPYGARGRQTPTRGRSKSPVPGPGAHSRCTQFARNNV
jgi:hypothetical protein